MWREISKDQVCPVDNCEFKDNIKCVLISWKCKHICELKCLKRFNPEERFPICHDCKKFWKHLKK